MVIHDPNTEKGKRYREQKVSGAECTEGSSQRAGAKLLVDTDQEGRRQAGFLCPLASHTAITNPDLFRDAYISPTIQSPSQTWWLCQSRSFQHKRSLFLRWELSVNLFQTFFYNSALVTITGTTTGIIATWINNEHICFIEHVIIAFQTKKITSFRLVVLTKY